MTETIVELFHCTPGEVLQLLNSSGYNAEVAMRVFEVMTDGGKVRFVSPDKSFDEDLPVVSRDTEIKVGGCSKESCVPIRAQVLQGLGFPAEAVDDFSFSCWTPWRNWVGKR